MSTDDAPLSDCPAALGYAMRIRPEEEADGGDSMASAVRSLPWWMSMLMGMAGL